MYESVSNQQNSPVPETIPASHHGILNEQISRGARVVLQTLHDAGFQAFLVGGGVRDLLLRRTPKDFDVSTNALPDEIKNVFARRCRIIGRRFRLAHVRCGTEIIEVSTFRGSGKEGLTNDRHANVPNDNNINTYGTVDEDVWRRDFTVNALLYSMQHGTVVDYVAGMRDIENRKLRLIGDPLQRYQEDPIRLLRAVRFAADLGFQIHRATEQPISQLATLLTATNHSRLFHEILKVFMRGMALPGYHCLRSYGLLEYLFPQIESVLQQQSSAMANQFITQALENSDIRCKEGKPVSPGFLFAAMLWLPLMQVLKNLQHDSPLPDSEVMDLAMKEVLHTQNLAMPLPARVREMIYSIWLLQIALEAQAHSDMEKISRKRYFRAAYDFLLLRHQIFGGLQKTIDFWYESSVMAAANRRHYGPHRSKKVRRYNRSRSHL